MRQEDEEKPDFTTLDLEVSRESGPVSILSVKLNFLEALFCSLTKDLSFQDFMRDVLIAASDAVKSEAGSILEVNFKNQSVFFRAAFGLQSDQVLGFVIPLGKGIVGHVIETKMPILVDNVNENTRHLKSIQAAVGFEVQNMIAIPIMVRGQVYGVLELLNRIGSRTFTEEDRELLGSICDLIGKAVEIRLMISWGNQRKSAA